MNAPVSSDQMMQAFERHWKAENKDKLKKLATWLARSDVWGDAGYEQPCVHFEWLYFKKGVEWARKQK